MNQFALNRRRPMLGRIVAASSVIAAGISFLLLGSRLEHFAVAASRAAPPRWPDLSSLLDQPWPLQVHLIAALAAVALGAVMMARRKGERFHRVAGWAWFGLMMTVALSSLFIRELNGGVSFLHFFAAWIIVFLPLAVFLARHHRVAEHRMLMRVLFYGSLLISGALAFLPGRFMWQLFF